jgi:hypothetical protein
VGNCLTSWVTISFSRSTLLHGVCYFVTYVVLFLCCMWELKSEFLCNFLYVSLRVIFLMRNSPMELWRVVCSYFFFCWIFSQVYLWIFKDRSVSYKEVWILPWHNKVVCCLRHIWWCIQKFLDWVDNEINNNKHSLGSNTNGYGGRTHWTDWQNSDTTAPSGRELYHLQFLLQAASLETFGYTLLQYVT